MANNFEKIGDIKRICRQIITDSNNTKCMLELKSLIENSSNDFIRIIQPNLLSTFYSIIKSVSDNTCKSSQDSKKIVVDILASIFEKSNIDKLVLFFNIYAFLLYEIHDHLQHKVKNIFEEYKLSILKCTNSLTNCLSTEVITDLYTKENAPKLSQMMWVALDIAKTEEYKALRITALETIMILFNVYKDEYLNDLVIKKQVADSFLYFLPGVASGLTKVALVDEKVGHKIPKTALKALGRIISLLMGDYEAVDKKINSKKVKIMNLRAKNKITENGYKEMVLEEFQNTVQTPEWYCKADKNLQNIVVNLKKLAYASHFLVKLELAKTCELLVHCCLNTMPLSMCHIVEILITLSEDDNKDVSNLSGTALKHITEKLSQDEYKFLIENLEDGFYTCINGLFRKFVGLDENEQMAALSLLIGYISLFGKYKLCHVLYSSEHLKKLLTTLVHICKFENQNVSIFEDYVIQDLELVKNMKKNWKVFTYFSKDSIRLKLESLCRTLTENGALHICTDFLLDLYVNDTEHRKEATFLLNELILGIKNPNENVSVIKNVMDVYTDQEFWFVPLQVMIDDLGYEHNLAEIQSNVIQVCLHVEGIGNMALVLEKNFQMFLLKTLFLVLVRAGSHHPLIQAAGLDALGNIAAASGYRNTPTLMNNNADYFSYYVERKLVRLEENDDVFDVLAVVLMYGTVDILHSLQNIIKEVLTQSCDKFKEKRAYTYLRVFKLFVNNLYKWLKVSKKVEPFKTRKQKEQEVEGFQVGGITENAFDNDFSDNVMGKSVDEMWKEDMEKNQKDVEDEMYNEEEEYKKPEPPNHIKLTVAILGRALHFLPSKKKNRKLLVLEILNDGLEIIKEWDDELLPIVHQIWSPLIGRFRETDEPLVVSRSVQLLATMARVSKDFIRMRTSKDVLPQLVQILQKLSVESYLKDKGAGYRYTQSYKLQMVILENFAPIITDLDLLEEEITTAMEGVFKYLSDKQPRPLQILAVEFFKHILNYESNLIPKLELWLAENMETEYEKNLIQIKSEYVSNN